MHINDRMLCGCDFNEHYSNNRTHWPGYLANHIVVFLWSVFWTPASAASPCNKQTHNFATLRITKSIPGGYYHGLSQRDNHLSLVSI